MSATVSRDPGNETDIQHAWPAYALIGIVLGAAVFAFSPRPHPSFPPTLVHPDQLLVTGLAQVEGPRFLAVGEQGRILLADNANGPWREANVEPQRGSTFTQVRAVGGGVLLAVGHDSWIVRSTDGGIHWKEVSFDPARSEVLLGLAGPYDGKLYAFGAFGQFMVSADRGLSWQRMTLEEEGARARPAATVSDVPDIFAGAADIGGGLGESHINGLTLASDGSLILVGERGLIARSRNGGQSWRVLPEIYAGSFYGVLSLPTGRLLVHGMRGNVFYSDNLGASWQRSEIPGHYSLFGGAVAPDGSVLLVGSNNSILVSHDNGAHFTRVSDRERHSLASVLPLGREAWLLAGEGGLLHMPAVPAHP